MKKQLLFGAMLFGALVSANAQTSCANAVELPIGITNVTIDGGEYESNCWAFLNEDAPTNNDDQADAAAWYKVTVTTSGTYRVNTNLTTNDPTTIDTRISVYHGASCDALTCWTSSDDVYAGAQTDPNNNFFTDFQFPVVAGETYYIVFDNQWMDPTAPNVFDVDLSFMEPGCTTNELHENWENSGHYYFCWDRIDNNEVVAGVEGSSWTLFTDLNFDSEDVNADNAAAIFAPTDEDANDDFLISNPKQLIAGTEYTVNVMYNAGDTTQTPNANESFEVAVFQIDENNQYNLVEVIGGETEIAQSGDSLDVLKDNATTGSYTFIPETDGDYNFAIHSSSVSGGGVLIIFEVNVDGTMGTGKALASKLSIFPNPATSVINITNADNILVNGVVITDLNGRTVKSVKLDGVAEAQVNVSDLANGMYMMTVSSDKGTMTQKIVKN